MKLQLLAAGQGVYTIQIDGKPTGYNAVNDPRLMPLIDREVTHLIHRPEAFAEFVQSNPEWKAVIVPRINTLQEDKWTSND